MRTNFVLIDFENVRPDGPSLKKLRPEYFHVLVFLGANQSRLPKDLATALQPKGERVKYVEINGHGRNALDFHIAFYLGELATLSPTPVFHIVSKDTGFDLLLGHLRKRRIIANRANEISEIPFVKAADATTPAARANYVQQYLATKPAAVEGLRKRIGNMFPNGLTDDETHSVVGELVKKKFLTISNDKVTYTEAAASFRK